MSTTITISLSDADYERLRTAAAQTSSSPEALAAAIAAKYSTEESRKRPSSHSERTWEDPAIALMRANGHLADTRSYPLPQVAADLPPYGSPEYKALLEEIGQQLSDAVEQSGKSILDLIERR